MLLLTDTYMSIVTVIRSSTFLLNKFIRVDTIAVIVVTEETHGSSVVFLGLGECHTALGTLELDFEPLKQALAMIDVQAGRLVVSGAPLPLLLPLLDLLWLVLQTACADAAINFICFW